MGKLYFLFESLSWNDNFSMGLSNDVKVVISYIMSIILIISAITALFCVSSINHRPSNNLRMENLILQLRIKDALLSIFLAMVINVTIFLTVFLILFQTITFAAIIIFVIFLIAYASISVGDDENCSAFGIMYSILKYKYNKQTYKDEYNVYLNLYNTAKNNKIEELLKWKP